MWRVLLACLALVLPATATLAAERVLLVPKSTSFAVPSAAATPEFRALRSAANHQGKVTVIVGLRVPFAPEGLLEPAEAREQRQEIAAAGASVRASFAAAVTRAPKAVRGFDSVPFMAMEVTPAELERLARDPNVISISENRLRKLSLKQSLPLVQGNLAHAAGYTGTGQTIAILDTGVDRNHPFLGGRVVSEACYSTTNSSTTSLCPGGVASSTVPGSGAPCSRRLDGCGHGTHVAGIAAGANSSMQGVARGANIIAVQVFSRFGNDVLAWDSDIIKGLERVYQLRNQFSIAAVNMSLGGGQYFGTCDAQYAAGKSVVDNLKAAGIATVVASGNESFTNSMAAPACISSTVSVGSVSTRNWGLCDDGQPTAKDKVACYSNAASFLSLLAPGSPISSSVPGRRFESWHGTSMAAPHVAGAFAVIKQKKPDASVDEILTALKETGTPVTDYRNTAITTPRINVKAALDRFPAIQQLLSYQRQGLGSVSFSPAGSVANCSDTCSSSFDFGTIVTLTATPQAGWAFAGWSGACTGKRTRCAVTMASARNVTATFTALPTFALTYDARGTGTGTITFSPSGTEACTGDCTRNIITRTRVTLTAQAGTNSTFTGWGGACKGKRTTCTVTMSRARTVTATFSGTAPTTIGALSQP